MVAPFIPNITQGETDVSNFDKEFTNMSMEQTPVNNYFTQNFADEVQFSNFTYVHNELNHAMQAQDSSKGTMQFDADRHDSI